MSSPSVRFLAGRSIIISGGANGIGRIANIWHGQGRATAQRLAAHGASLCISDINAVKGQETCNSLAKAYPEQSFVFDRVDVTNYDEVAQHVSQSAKRASQGLSGLVCAAGIAIPGPRMHETTIGTYLKHVNVNLHGTMYYNHAALGQFVAQNARKQDRPLGGYAIVNIGSKASVEGLPGASAYCATKHAILGFSRVNAKDYADEEIRTNVLCPGVTLTDLVQGLIDSGNPELQPEHTLARVAMRRYGKPEEMAATVAFMLGPDSAYMTGQAIVVDGAWSP